MQSLLLQSTLAVLALVGLGQQAAQAQVQVYFGQPYYGQPYYQPPNLYMPAPAAYYAPPVYYPPPAYYPEPYVWSRSYFASPMYSGWYGQRYYPWTNTYSYRYRVVPNYPVPWWYSGPR